MKITLREQIERIKDLNEQINIYRKEKVRHMTPDQWAKEYDEKAAAHNKQMEKEIRDEERQARLDQIQFNKDLYRDLINPKVNILGQKIPKDQLEKLYQLYEQNKNNPNLLKDNRSKFDAKTRFFAINKLMTQYGSHPQHWVTRGINNVLGREPQSINTEQLLELILDPKIGGFDNFIKLYQTNFKI